MSIECFMSIHCNMYCSLCIPWAMAKPNIFFHIVQISMEESQLVVNKESDVEVIVCVVLRSGKVTNPTTVPLDVSSSKKSG